ncbi:MAG: polymer-forming cytoskeletal protein [Gammaproteobacteria bacterium]|jgi:cytoskeletal protein CcmA (bactofilin family)|nr:polymer-forming cytoskeletal protein [Gammaproteobacteria bacterium]
MFGSGNKSKRNAEIDSLVGGNTKICGDVHFTGGLHVDGVIEGNVIAESDNSVLTTSEKGQINGNVTVHNIVLNGAVVGDVHALHHVELAPNARVTGNVYYQVIEMAMGAEVNGNLIHTKGGDKVGSNMTQAAKKALEPDMAVDNMDKVAIK